ncbi:hypothetical protein [Desulfotalea psychrophila]|nr:hypothetical protein [Desulfotalea psychrophila]
MFIYNDEFNIKYIDALVVYDRRFDSSLELIRIFNKNALIIDTYSNFEISGSFKEYHIESKPVKLVSSLVKLLSDIDRLLNIRQEINDIDQDIVFEKFEQQVKNG